MRKSLSELIEVASVVRQFLGVSSFQIYDSVDYCCCKFEVPALVNPRKLLELAGDFLVRIYGEDENVIIKIYNEEIE